MSTRSVQRAFIALLFVAHLALCAQASPVSRSLPAASIARNILLKLRVVRQDLSAAAPRTVASLGQGPLDRQQGASAGFSGSTGWRIWGYVTIGVFAGLCIIPWTLYIGMLSCGQCCGAIFSCFRPRKRKRVSSPAPPSQPPAAPPAPPVRQAADESVPHIV